MYAASIIQDEDGDPVLDVELALKSQEYKAYINAVCELEKVSIAMLSDTKRIAFFLNIYQCMYIHNFFKMVNESKSASKEGYFKSFKRLLYSGKEPFYYNIAGKNYTLDDIKHGMLRGNKQKPGYCMRTLSHL